MKPSIKKILIANRGEIAVRIIRACADYGVPSVAIYADVDIDALHARMATEAYSLNGNSPAQTYLNIEKIIAIAQKSHANAIHPGYGFLSENAAFAQAVIDAGFIWIGPSPAAIARLGDKVQARKIALKVGAPLVVGTTEPVKNAQEVLAFAQQHGLPIIIKAAFGGGGRGMKIAWQMHEVAELYASAVREAVTAFGRGACFVEQFLDKPRHIEAQVVADTHGNVVVLGTRDCSLQRRNQKLIEEAPAPFLSAAQRSRIHHSARAICVEANYTNAGTVEFLLSPNGTLSFLEVNTRLQVEHTITEAVTGIDIVLEQLRIADGLPLSMPTTPTPLGHAFEFRINAEDAGHGFLPTPGVITQFIAPSGPGVRVDTDVATGSLISENFDSLMAKLIITGANRQQAIKRARRALQEFAIEGVASVLPFHRAVMEHPDFVAEAAFNVHTRWIETDFAQPITAMPRCAPIANAHLVRTFIEIDGRRHAMGLPAAWLSTGMHLATTATPTATDLTPVNTNAVVAAISGTLLNWQIPAGAKVQAGDVIAVMEAMKMETAITAHQSGLLSAPVDAGTFHNAGACLALISPIETGE